MSASTYRPPEAASPLPARHCRFAPISAGRYFAPGDTNVFTGPGSTFPSDPLPWHPFFCPLGILLVLPSTRKRSDFL